MGIGGVWINEYGSLMELAIEADGRMYGTYSSTTGSTGTFPVQGWADPGAADSERGRSLAISISWRSLGDEAPDPSWHWVSGLGGQLVEDGGVERLILLHDMVATEEFPDQALVGRHLDKLVYSRAAKRESPAGPQFRPSAVTVPTVRSSTLDGEWRDDFDPSTDLSLRFLDGGQGLVSGSFRIGGLSCPMRGFADAFAESEGCALQALSLSGLLPGGESVSLSGSLDLSSAVLTLASFRSRGTAPSLSYTQTRFDQHRMKRTS
ncbi:MAG TPA: avidin/streptavidin family protein [Rectinemataceae bacterium]|nr:avidin/streptavidin family protein [Rectinemataceae bacterium]